ncbi:hypothetical protein Bpfe_012353 [Biomphalaria pfeifferi]|uniref:Uncharacterized protein n=1 Tax=Biomphalaria pfeifferi TaxID=112525 RepID=A0AAD8FB10_BIOPF|nr:hypothetical protein Bpfe_012353 [Biomphalaria pfeifferi]
MCRRGRLLHITHITTRLHQNLHDYRGFLIRCRRGRLMHQNVRHFLGIRDKVQTYQESSSLYFHSQAIVSAREITDLSHDGGRLGE